MTETQLTAASIVARDANVLHDVVDNEVVAMSTTSALCYGLNGVGSRIWQLMAKPVRVGDLSRTLAAEFDVDPATCEREVLGLLREALAAGMIRVDDSAPEQRERKRA